ncbi:hypothetical protein C0993_004550 [Termitomyces sp. T159_Od127]|nr:hypothetical protein C0993_004550 [Termitomyces sp. T159_Od127]
MVHGPPTPPPTTETEIQDQARVAVEDLPPPVPSTTQLDAFQTVFPTIVDLASEANFQSLIQVAENANLQVCDPVRLPPARFALTQLPEDVYSTPLVNSLFGLLVSTWDRDHANVYFRAQELRNLVQQPEFFDEQLGSVLSGLVKTFVETFRRRTVNLLSAAYTSLPAPLAQMYLGMKQDELLAAAQGEGWLFNASTNLFIPSTEASIATTQPSPSSLPSFHSVTDSVAKLEL